jgi:hypothetical protein
MTKAMHWHRVGGGSSLAQWCTIASWTTALSFPCMFSFHLVFLLAFVFFVVVEAWVGWVVSI